MRLWSLHPKYLDTRGLVALWREGLLAKSALGGLTKGYKNHPQLIRFKSYENPMALINAYLYQVYLEAKRRNYSFNISKIEPIVLVGVVPVTKGQLRFEFTHLLKKIEIRDKRRFEELKNEAIGDIEPNSVFKVVNGNIELWEKSREMVNLEV